MKIPFKFQEIDSLDYNVYKTKFKAATKKLKAKSNSPETAVEVFLNQEFEFAGGTKEAFILMGKMAGPWKKWVKDSVKANKKMTMIGRGYVETDDAGNDVFKFVKLRGAAKIDKVQKAAKALLRASKIGLSLVESLEDAPISQEEDEFLDDLAGGDEDTPQDPQAELEAKKEEAKALVQAIAATQLDIKNQLDEIKALASSDNRDRDAVYAKIGMVIALQDRMEDEIKALQELAIAQSYVDKFSQNLAQIKSKTEAQFSRAEAAIAKIEDDMKSLIDGINSMIAQFGANAGYKIQL